MKESFILHTNAWPAIEKLTRTQRGDLFTAIMYKQMDKPIPKMDPTVEIAYLFISAQMDRDNEKYDKMVENRKAAARKRWDNASASKAMQSNATQCLNDNENVNDNENENVNERYVSLPSLSPRDEASLREVTGDRADALIEDVKRYYSTHPEKQFPGWPIALAQFDSNQRRWGRTNVKPQKSIDEIAAEAFKDMEDVI